MYTADQKTKIVAQLERNIEALAAQLVEGLPYWRKKRLTDTYEALLMAIAEVEAPPVSKNKEELARAYREKYLATWGS
jgi:hypothetical protein